MEHKWNSKGIAASILEDMNHDGIEMDKREDVLNDYIYEAMLSVTSRESSPAVCSIVEGEVREHLSALIDTDLTIF